MSDAAEEMVQDLIDAVEGDCAAGLEEYSEDTQRLRDALASRVRVLEEALIEIRGHGTPCLGRTAKDCLVTAIATAERALTPDATTEKETP